MNPVSTADKQAEIYLKEELLNILPNNLFIGEELFEQQPDILHYLNQNSQPVWVVDPIDGTDNFISGKEGFGIMVCLVFGDIIHSSWLYEISTQRITIFHKDEGITINDTSFNPPSHCQKPFTGQIGKKLYQFPETQHLVQRPLIDLSIDTEKDSSIISYHRMLTGELDFLIFRITYPWDHLPGIALLSTNGTITTRWDGTAFHFSDTHKGLIVARNHTVLHLVLEQIIKPLALSQPILNMT